MTEKQITISICDNCGKQQENFNPPFVIYSFNYLFEHTKQYSTPRQDFCSKECFKAYLLKFVERV